jgi:starch synthase
MILALDTAFSTFVSTDGLDAMHRSAMGRSFSWGLLAACYSALYCNTMPI